MLLPVSSPLNRHQYERLLAHAAGQPDFAYLGSVGTGDGRGFFSGFSACAMATECVNRGDGNVLDTRTLAATMESLVHRYEVPMQPQQHFLTGGWIGFLSYEFGYVKEKRLCGLCPEPATALMSAGFYLWTASHNRTTGTYYLWIHPECPEQTRRSVKRWLDAESGGNATDWRMVTPFKARQPADEFIAGVGAVQRYISAGDCYQANLSQEFHGRYAGNPWVAFQALTEANPTPYSAFLKTGNATVLCISPERFLEIRDRTIKTSPIKGTRPRGTTPSEDTHYAAELEASEKDRAENLMIVDLLRNDLSVHAAAGSVTVETLFALESYRNVHHLVSHIRAELANDASPMQVLFDAFPGGSITGAPKIRAMEIIRELEAHWRGPYCGSVFYRGLDNTLDSNIAIRTLLCDEDGTIRCWGGGGIVADSVPQSEFQETLTKVKPLMDFLDNLNRGH